MIMCVIEFGTIPGMEERNRALVTEMLKESAKIDGFISKETFLGRDQPSKVITISYWKDEASLDRWMKDPEHRRVIPIGRNELFTHYSIRVAEVKREKSWRKPGASA
jgi:heme-degrading monooxygenase HmoA